MLRPGAGFSVGLSTRLTKRCLARRQVEIRWICWRCGAAGTNTAPGTGVLTGTAGPFLSRSMEQFGRGAFIDGDPNTPRSRLRNLEGGRNMSIVRSIEYCAVTER